MMLLDKINSPEDLKKLDITQLSGLSAEIRERILKVVCRSGGHLASSLGAVELIVALHYCLDLRRDKIIFDVGHQAYAHKILTGRNKRFDTLRQFQGISGFPSKDESAYDVFTTGHSSNAVSLALGFVCSKEHSAQEQDCKVVVVIGDGSLSGGLCFEGLNNAGHLKKDLLVVLNTNELSISPNVGALSTYLNKIISLPIYNRFKDSLESFVKSRMPKGSRIIKIASKFEEGLKGLFVPGIFFEELGFRYFGPFEGHNFGLLIPAIKNILDIKGPRLLHVVTKKGKGYAPAEREPVKFHSIGSFDIATGKPSQNNRAELLTYTQAFSRKLLELAGSNKKIVAVTAAMPEGTGLDKIRDTYPDRFFDVGIAEAHAVCFAAGLAKAGLRPVVAIYSTFLQRAYDQIIEDVALQNLPVIFAVDRAGIVGEDGVTHQGIFDIGFFRNIPNFVVMAPRDSFELGAMLEFCLTLDKPAVIRYPKASCPRNLPPACRLELGKPEVLIKGEEFSVIALGSAVESCFEALALLQKDNLSGSLINARFVKPLDIQMIHSAAPKSKIIFTVEEGVIEGGFGSAICEATNKPVVRIGLPCEFIPHGRRDILLEKYGLSAAGIAGTIKSVMKNG